MPRRLRLAPSARISRRFGSTRTITTVSKFDIGNHFIRIRQCGDGTVPPDRGQHRSVSAVDRVQRALSHELPGTQGAGDGEDGVEWV